MATMIKFIPGQCEAAIEQYKKAFGATVSVFMRFADVEPHEKIQTEEEKQYIYHAQLLIGGQRYLLCDNVFDDLERGHSLYLVASFKNGDDVKRAYDIMQEDAVILHPYTSTGFDNGHCALIDRFGIQWDIMVYHYAS